MANEIKNNIINTVNTIVNEKLRKLKYDKTFKSTIWGKNDDGTYQISYMNQIYNVPNALGTELGLGQSVWVCIPSGVFRNMHIYAGRTNVSGGGIDGNTETPDIITTTSPTLENSYKGGLRINSIYGKTELNGTLYGGKTLAEWDDFIMNTVLSDGTLVKDVMPYYLLTYTNNFSFVVSNNPIRVSGGTYVNNCFFTLGYYEANSYDVLTQTISSASGNYPNSPTISYTSHRLDNSGSFENNIILANHDIYINDGNNNNGQGVLWFAENRTSDIFNNVGDNGTITLEILGKNLFLNKNSNNSETKLTTSNFTLEQGDYTLSFNKTNDKLLYYTITVNFITIGSWYTTDTVIAHQLQLMEKTNDISVTMEYISDDDLNALTVGVGYNTDDIPDGYNDKEYKFYFRYINSKTGELVDMFLTSDNPIIISPQNSTNSILNFNVSHPYEIQSCLLGRNNMSGGFASSSSSVTEFSYENIITLYYASHDIYTSDGQLFMAKTLDYSEKVIQDTEVYNFQVERGNNATSYVDSVLQNITITTPNGLAGVPVDDNGNYTDDDGQQWICDEIDIETQKNITRIGRINSYTNEEITTPYISSKYGLEEGAIIYYVLDEEVITDLPPTDVMSIKSLKTDTGITTISTDSIIIPTIKTEYGTTNVGGTSLEALNKAEMSFCSVSNGKSLIASAITDKGVETASDATFKTMAENILAISSGGEYKCYPDIFNHGDVVGLSPMHNFWKEVHQTNFIGWSVTADKIYLPQTANANLVFGSPMMFTGYKYLCFDVDASGRNGTYNTSKVGLRKASNGWQTGEGGEFLNHWVDLTLYVNQTNYDGTSPWYKLSRQVVKLSVENLAEPYVLAMHCCDCGVNIYSIWLE